MSVVAFGLRQFLFGVRSTFGSCKHYAGPPNDEARCLILCGAVCAILIKNRHRKLSRPLRGQPASTGNATPPPSIEAMPLTLRPTRLSPRPDANDWTIHDDGMMVGRIYEDRAANLPQGRWFWALNEAAGD